MNIGKQGRLRLNDKEIKQLAKDLSSFKGITVEDALQELGVAILEDGSISAIYETMDTLKKWGLS